MAAIRHIGFIFVYAGPPTKVVWFEKADKIWHLYYDHFAV